MHHVPAIEATDLSYIRSGEPLFESFSFQIPAGAYTAVIGPNGGGKTTLVRILLGLLPPSAGEVRLFGVSCTQHEARRRVGYVPQRGGLIDALFPATALEVVSAGRSQRRGLRAFLEPHDCKTIDAAFETMGITALKTRTIGSLSGGERQRVLLARALASEPDILILDEPIDGLDPASREGFYYALRRIHQSGKTILFVTHDVHRITQEADSAICLRHELVCHGEHACHLDGNELRNIFHGSHAEITAHHGN